MSLLYLIRNTIVNNNRPTDTAKLSVLLSAIGIDLNLELEAGVNEPARGIDHYSILSAAREMLMYGFKLPNVHLLEDEKLIVIEKLHTPDVSKVDIQFIMTFDVDSRLINTDVITKGVDSDTLDEIDEVQRFHYEEDPIVGCLFENIELSLFTRLPLVLANFYTRVTQSMFNNEYSDALFPQAEFIIEPTVKEVIVSLNGQRYMKLDKGSIWTFSEFKYNTDLLVLVARMFLKDMPEYGEVNIVQVPSQCNPDVLMLAVDEV